MENLENPNDFGVTNIYYPVYRDEVELLKVFFMYKKKKDILI